MDRTEDAVTVNVTQEVDHAEIRTIIADELNAAFGQLHECGECGLVWGRKEASGLGRRKPDGTRCPDCREEDNIYNLNI